MRQAAFSFLAILALFVQSSGVSKMNDKMLNNANEIILHLSKY
ncbi:hypothetical protein ABES80_19715 [Bacillus gobiensis]